MSLPLPTPGNAVAFAQALARHIHQSSSFDPDLKSWGRLDVEEKVQMLMALCFDQGIVVNPCYGGFIKPVSCDSTALMVDGVVVGLDGSLGWFNTICSQHPQHRQEFENAVATRQWKVDDLRGRSFDGPEAVAVYEERDCPDLDLLNHLRQWVKAQVQAAFLEQSPRARMVGCVGRL